MTTCQSIFEAFALVQRPTFEVSNALLQSVRLSRRCNPDEFCNAAVPGGNYPVAINKDLTVEQVCAEWAKGHQDSSTIPAKFKPYFLGANETGALKFPELARTANLTGLPFTKDDGR
jgi:hypothetical protein